MKQIKLTQEARSFMQRDIRKPDIEHDDRLTPDNCEDRNGFPLRTLHYCPACEQDQIFWFRGHQEYHGKVIGAFYDCSTCGDTWLWRKE